MTVDDGCHLLKNPLKTAKLIKNRDVPGNTIMKLFDVHTHIQDRRIFPSRDAVIRRSQAAGIERIMCCGTCEPDWESVKLIAGEYEPVMVSFGIHPWFVGERSADWKDRLEEILIKYPEAGVGEIGLDRMDGFKNEKEQENVFTEQLRIARKYGRPVSIHCRSAWGVMPEVIRREGSLPDGGVIHSWSGSAEMVKVFEKLGACISFSGSVTRPDHKKAHRACRAVSQERLLIETDSPDIIPDGIDASLNEPAFLVKVLEAVARLRREPVQSIAAYTFENAVNLFGTPAE